MIDGNKYIFRPATTSDIDFLVETVIQAEKSFTGACGLANYFGISEDELRGYLFQMFEEEIDGCEFSVTSFIVVEYEGQVVAAMGGWLEGDNEDEMPSSILKSNLIQYVMPIEAVLKAKENIPIIKELSIKRQESTYQLEYSYVLPEHQGQMLIQCLMKEHIKRAKSIGPHVKTIQAHAFEGNKVIVLINKMMGFKMTGRVIATNPRILEFFPYDTMVLFEKEL
jgi:GNAT superfamily N-acetyltransferase